MKELAKYIIDERTGLKYELVGDYYYPCLEAPEAPKVGRFGMMYHDYLRNNKKVTYSGLMLSGKLKEQIERLKTELGRANTEAGLAEIWLRDNKAIGQTAAILQSEPLKSAVLKVAAQRPTPEIKPETQIRSKDRSPLSR